MLESFRLRHLSENVSVCKDNQNQKFFSIESIARTKKICDFRVWLERPQCLYTMLFVDFFKKFDYSYRAPANLPQSINLQMDESPQLQIDVQYFQNIEKPVYLFRLKNDQKRIIRLNPVPLDCGEDWYFRLLAKNVPFRSFAEAYQILGNCLSIFLIFINFLISVFINKILRGSMFCTRSINYRKRSDDCFS